MATLFFNGMNKHAYFDASTGQQIYDSDLSDRWTSIDISNAPYTEQKYFGILDRLTNNYCIKMRGEMEEVSFCVGSNGISTFIWTIHLSSEDFIELHVYRPQGRLIVNSFKNNVITSTIEINLANVHDSNVPFGELGRGCKKLLMELVALVEDVSGEMRAPSSYGIIFSTKNVLEGTYLTRYFMDEVRSSNTFFSELPDVVLLKEEKDCFVTTSSIRLNSN